MAGKKYRGSVRIGTDQDGKPIKKYVTAQSQRELENAKAAIREHYVYGEPLPVNMLFFEYAENWYRLKKEPFVSTSVRASYKSCFMKHILPEFGLQNLKAISAGQKQVHFTWRSHRHLIRKEILFQTHNKDGSEL